MDPGLPPKLAIVMLCRSFMRVLNIAHVDAQFALPTEPQLAQTSKPLKEDEDLLTDHDLAVDELRRSAENHTGRR